MNISKYSASTILTSTGGFLGGECGYTHTMNPGVGCPFGMGFCGRFCYARQGMAHRMKGDGQEWGEYLKVKANAAEVLERELSRAARRNAEHRHHVNKLAIFASSSTDPCAGPLLDIFRECLRVVARFPVRKFVVQTRSPAVMSLQPDIEALGSRGVVSFTIETDSQDIWLRGPTGAPGIDIRRSTFEKISRWNIVTHLAVSPCLPLASPDGFADWIGEHADYATVDTFVSGDGSPKGRRTAASELPVIYEREGWDWRDESQAQQLLQLLRQRMNERVGWSSAGFNRLAKL